jgi:Protein of unknown function (DUF2612)
MSQRSVDDYLALVTPFLAGKAKFMATLAVTLQPFADSQAFLASIPHAFDLDYAIGAQLDIVGQWVGVTRNIPTDIGFGYFSFGRAGLGFGSTAPFWDIGDPFYSTTTIAVNDSIYRQLLRAKVQANSWNGTANDVQRCLNPYGGYPFADDKGGMQLTLAMSGLKLAGSWLGMFKYNSVGLRPSGISIKTLLTSVNGAPIFGFGSSNNYVSGFGTGSIGVTPDYITAQLIVPVAISQAFATATAGAVTTKIS